MLSFQSEVVSDDIPPHWSCRKAELTCVVVRRLESILGVSGISENTLEDGVSGVSILCCERRYIE